MEKNYYKISPEVKELVIKTAKEHPESGSRKISLLVQEQFKRDISKSSIAAILKAASLNKPVGRIGEKKETIIPREDSGGILALKFILDDRTAFFLDASLQSIWPASRIPQGLSRGLVEVKEELEGSVLSSHRPLVLLAVPGSKSPPGILLDFIASFQGREHHKAIKCIELYTKDGRMFESIQLIPDRKRYFLIGLWPWQYPNQRAELFKENGCFSCLRPVIFEKDKQEIFAILTNLEESSEDNARVNSLFLERWPEPEKSYGNFLRNLAAFFPSRKGAR